MGLLSSLRAAALNRAGQVPGNPQKMPWRPNRVAAPPPPGGVPTGPMPPLVDPVTGLPVAPAVVKPIPGTGPMPPLTPPVGPAPAPAPAADPQVNFRRDFHRRARMHQY